MICVEPGCHNYSGTVCKMENFVQRMEGRKRKHEKVICNNRSDKHSSKCTLVVFSKVVAFYFIGAEPRYLIYDLGEEDNYQSD